MTTPTAPSFTIPDQPGELCNFHGSDTSTDAIQLKVHAASKIGNVNVKVYRQSRSGIFSGTPQSVWASGWTGTPSAQAVPGVASEAAPVVATYNGRVYVLFLGTPTAGGTGDCFSAPLTAGGVGSWRAEDSLGSVSTWFGYGQGSYLFAAGANQMAAVGGYLYACVGTTNTAQNAVILRAPINSDGSLGAWASVGSAPYSLASGASLVGGMNAALTAVYSYLIGEVVLCGGKNTSGTVVATCGGAGINSDGSLGAFTTATALPNARQNGKAYYDSNFPTVYYLGGDDGTTAHGDFWFATVQAGGALNAFAVVTNATAMPVARTGMALTATFGPDGNTHFWAFGGSATVGGAATTTIHHLELVAVGTAGGAWTLQSYSLPASGAGIVGFSGSSPLFSSDPGDQGGASGATQATSWLCFMYTGSPVYTGNVHATSPAFVNGNAPGLTGTDIGGVGSVTNNADGSADLIFDYGAWGGSQTTLLDGDQITVTISTTDITGNVGTSATTLINIGQAPTVSSPTTGAVTTGQPTLSMTFTQGAGGGNQVSWRIQVKNGATVVFDTGVTYGSADAVTLLLAPMLASATGYTVVYTVTSTDTAMTGSSSSGTSTQTVTPSYTAPSVPTSVTATPNNATGGMTVGWTNPGGSTATGNRVYYRRNGTSTWYLLADSQPTGTIGSATSQTYYDQLVPAIAYDFAVSAITATGESAMSTAVTNVKLDPIAGGWPAMLHVLGVGATHAILRTKDSPKWKETTSSELSIIASTVAPKVRFGIPDYRSAELSLYIPSVAELDAIQSVVAQAKAGKALVYRDSFGTYVTCTIAGELDIEYRAPVARFATLRLIQVPNTFTPSTAPYLVASGLLASTNGSVVPLATDELPI